jgi:hypothetical protein
MPLLAVFPTHHEHPKTQPKPTPTIKAVVHAVRVAPTPAPQPITWQDNPQGCNQDTQWIAAQEPFWCIDKPEVVQTPATAPTVASTPALAPQAVSYGGSHQDWMQAAGIPQSEWFYVEYVMNRESGGNPNAVNASSGACGLFQQLPCGKWAHPWNDPVGAMIDATGYANARYGGWAGAYSAWLRQSWW